MGICTCKKRTDLFCFVHKRAVCENCIITQHPVCAVKTYVDWLTDSEYEESRCGVCKGQLSSDNLLRLSCLDMFHPECLDVYAKSLPPHTAKAGFVCPECKKPIFPNEEKSQLAIQLNKHLNQSSWAQKFMEKGTNGEANGVNAGNTNTNNTNSNSNVIQSSSSFPTLRSTAPISSTPDLQNKKEYNVSLEKAENGIEEDDEDKYKKKGVGELFVALGLAQATNTTTTNARGGGKNRQIRIRLNQKRIVVIIALLLTLVTVFVMAMSFSGSTGEEKFLPK